MHSNSNHTLFPFAVQTHERERIMIKFRPKVLKLVLFLLFSNMSLMTYISGKINIGILNIRFKILKC